MAYSRREVAPRDQIQALKRARDLYAELADRIHNDADSRLDAIERQFRENDARRIAKAYDRSLSNSLSQLSGMEKSHRTQSHTFGVWHRIAILIVLALSAALPLVYFYAAPSALKRFRPLGQIWNVTAKDLLPPVSSRPIPLPVKKVHNVAPAKADLADNLNPGTSVPAVAPLVQTTQKIAPAREVKTKKGIDKRPEKSLTQPAPDKRITSNTPEVAKIAIVPPSETKPLTRSADTPPHVEQSPPPAPETQIKPPAPSQLEPIAGTHTVPGYPPFSARVGEAGTTKISVAISLQGRAIDCRVSQSSGSDRLDRVACAHVTEYWRWKPLDGFAATPRTSVTVVWNLPKANRSR